LIQLYKKFSDQTFKKINPVIGFCLDERDQASAFHRHIRGKYQRQRRFTVSQISPQRTSTVRTQENQDQQYCYGKNQKSNSPNLDFVVGGDMNLA
jgi:hypothetical protein